MTKIQEMLQLLQTDGINSKQKVIKMLQEMHNQEPITIDELIEEAHNTAKEKGWWKKPQELPALIALVHSELSEALEEVRNGKDPNEVYYSGKAKKYLGDGTHIADLVVYSHTNEGMIILDDTFPGFEPREILTKKPEGVASELADVMIRIGDIAGAFGINLDAAIKEKLEHNRSRSHRHGNKVL